MLSLENIGLENMSILPFFPNRMSGIQMPSRNVICGVTGPYQRAVRGFTRTPFFGQQKSKGQKFPKFMQQIFKNVEFCGKKGKKIIKGKKNLKKGQNFFCRKAEYSHEL